jgi:tetratricopeptide (TPR) repeat protein
MTTSRHRDSLHLPDEELALLGEGGLHGEDAKRAHRHLAACSTCMAAYADAVRYRAAWLARPESFTSDPELVLAGIDARHSVESRAPAMAGEWPSFLRPRWASLAFGAGALAIAATVALRIVSSHPAPLVTDVPPVIAAALESESSRGLVLPGGEAGAARIPDVHRGSSMGDASMRHSVDSLVRLYESGPRTPHLAYVAGAGCLALGQLDLARDYTHEAIALYHSDPALLALAADIRLRSNDEAGAEELLRRALRHRPHDPTLTLNLAIVLREQGHLSESCHLLKTLARRSPIGPVGTRARSMASDPACADRL